MDQSTRIKNLKLQSGILAARLDQLKSAIETHRIRIEKSQKKHTL